MIKLLVVVVAVLLAVHYYVKRKFNSTCPYKELKKKVLDKFGK